MDEEVVKPTGKFTPKLTQGEFHAVHDKGEIQHKAIIDESIRMLEQQTGEKMFTFQLIKEIREGFEAIAVLMDKRILMGKVMTSKQEDRIGIRLQFNYLGL